MVKEKPTTEKLKMIIDVLKGASLRWDSDKAIDGPCDECGGYEERKIMRIPEGYSEYEKDVEYKRLCQKHLGEKREEIQRSLKDSLEKLEPILKEELEFREKLAKVTRYAQVKDLVEATKAIVRRRRKYEYGEATGFTEEELKKGEQLLRLLKKIEPKSSQFIDRGVAINEDLFLSGTATAEEYSSRPDPKITLTALDHDERYKAIARVYLTLGEAERLRNLLHECLEHVRIKGMIALIEKQMKVKLEEEREEEEEEG